MSIENRWWLACRQKFASNLLGTRLVRVGVLLAVRRPSAASAAAGAAPIALASTAASVSACVTARAWASSSASQANRHSSRNASKNARSSAEKPLPELFVLDDVVERIVEARLGCIAALAHNFIVPRPSAQVESFSDTFGLLSVDVFGTTRPFSRPARAGR